MTPKKVLQVIEIYREFFVSQNISKVDHTIHMPVIDRTRALEHCHNMLDKIPKFIDAGHPEKANEWLHFVQGVLWAYGGYSIYEMRNYNRPDPVEERHVC